MPLNVELAEIRDFLAAHAPFDSLPAAVLESIPPRLSIGYHRRGPVVLAAGSAAVELLVVRSGAVELRSVLLLLLVGLLSLGAGMLLGFWLGS